MCSIEVKIVRKECTLKYLILTFMMMISFFVFSSMAVSAENVSYEIKDNLFIELEEVDVGNPSLGYNIVGASYECVNGNDCEFDNVIIPDVYNDGVNNYPIVGIKDGDSLTGVLNNLSQVVKGKIMVGYRASEDNGKIITTPGTNFKTIGVCAFCGFTEVNEIDISESVTSIEINAFSGSGLKTLKINRYHSLDADVVTMIKTLGEGEEMLTSLSGVVLENIVFKNSFVLEYYIDVADVWSILDDSVKDKFTYEIIYRFYSDDVTYDEHVYHAGKSLKIVPEKLTRTGFNFVGWVSSEFSTEMIIDENSIAAVYSNDLIHEVYTKWELVESTQTIKTENNGTIDIDGKIVFGGLSNKLDMIVSVNHPLKNDSNVSISYSWEKKGIFNSIDSIDNDTNIHSIWQVKETGEYTCYVKVVYGDNEYSKISSISLKVEVLPKEILVKVNDNSTEYGTYVKAKEVDGNYFSTSNSLIENHVIKDYSVFEYTSHNGDKDINVGSYKDVLKAEITNIGYENDDTNYITNYKVTYDYGDLTVLAKPYIVNVNGDKVFTYGQQENLTDVIRDVVYGNISKTINITYVRKNAAVSDVGSYEYSKILSDNDNYNFVLNDNDYVVVIAPKDVYVEWDIDENLVYNGQIKNVSASLVGVDSELVIEVKKDGEKATLVNAGNYNLVAKQVISNSNYNLVNAKKEINIEKADSVFSGVQETFDITYNGEAQRPEISLNHNEGVVVYENSWENNISAGTYTDLVVKVDETPNYKAATARFSYKIKMYQFFVEPSVFEFAYGKEIANDIYKEYTLFGKTFGVRFVINNDAFGLDGLLAVGKYSIISANVDISNNELEVKKSIEPILVADSGIDKVIINQFKIKAECFGCQTTVYNGNERKLKTASNNGDINVRFYYVEDGVNVYFTEEDKINVFGYSANVEGNKVIKNAGKYKINFGINNSNYVIDGNTYFELNIDKADYDISGIELNDRKVNFNFSNHFINLEGELPKGLQVTYKIDGKKGNGTFTPFKHTVEAIFIGDFENYNYISPIKATLNVSVTWLFVTLGLIVLIGGAILFVTIYLLKKGKLPFVNRVNFKEIIRRNREIDAINLMIINKKLDLAKKDEVEEEAPLIIEENVKFVKLPSQPIQDMMVSLSFVDKLFKSEYGTKQFYSEVKNELLSYEGIASKVRRDYETFYLNNIPVAKFDVVEGSLFVYFALDPTLYKTSEYGHSSAAKEKDFSSVPLKLKVDSVESLRCAKMFVRIIRKRESIKAVSNFVKTDYAKLYTVKNSSLSKFKKTFSKDEVIKNIPIFKRNIVVCIIFSIITFGLYSIYWMYKVNDEVLSLSKEKGMKGNKVVILTFITFGIYGFFWLYEMGLNVDKIKGNFKYNSNVLFVILNFVLLNVVNLALIQNTINKNME